MERRILEYLLEREIVKVNDSSVATNDLRIMENEVVLSGNTLGLIELADYILNVALARPGYHIHLDNYTFFSDAERELIIAHTVDEDTK